MIDQTELQRRATLWAKGEWEIPPHIDTTGFDFNWRPPIYDRPYIHQFGTQWQKTGGPRFVIPEAEGVKYVDSQRATALPQPERWVKHYSNAEFDWSWHPDDTEPPYNYVFGNQYLSSQRCPTVEYLVPDATESKYVESVVATLISDRAQWQMLYPIDESLWDYTWTPHPWDPPLIYVWGNQFLSAEEMPTVEYHVEGATERKYMSDRIATLVNDRSCWKIMSNINDNFDFTWTPHPWDPPLIYVWGNQFLSAEEMPTVEYHVPGATERKYMSDQVATLVNDPNCWKNLSKIDESAFDFNWVPHPWDPPLIYVWGNQFLSAEEMPTVEYHVPGATERKYMNDRIATLVNDRSCWKVHAEIDPEFDFTWTPHPWDPPLIYVWGNQFLSAEEMPTVEYHVEGATERKYMNDRIATLVNDRKCWKVYAEIGPEFDLTWVPHPWDPPLIYVWGNQFLSAEEMPTVEYHVPGATERKYMSDSIATLRSNPNDWKIYAHIAPEFDLTWVPHPWDPPLIYVWGNQFLSAEEMPTVEYHVPGATERKYMNDRIATLVNDPERWTVVKDISDNFDFTWVPHPWDPPYIYVWGNQFLSAEEMPTVEYRVPGATERKYMSDRIATLVNTPERWTVVKDISDNFDFTWTPHPHDPPLIYTWGNQFLSAEEMPTVEYHVPGATERKYMSDQVATLVNDPTCWKIIHTINHESFDFTWVPHPWDPPLIYVWGNQFLSAEEMPTVEYHVPGATERKYMSDQVATLVNDPNCWKIMSDISEDFDLTWTPHPWDPPLIYVWGNQFLSAEEMPTVEYHVEGATERKYMSDQVATLVNDSRAWSVLSPIAMNLFDFTWTPHPWDPPLIYVWGNQFLSAEEMPTVEYHVEGATERKYMSDQVATLVNDPNCWKIMSDISEDFDLTWTPHPWDPPLIYTWGNQFLSAEEMPTVEYHVPGATERKYMSDRIATLVNDPNCWKINYRVDTSSFDFTWTPHPWDPPLIYTWGNQFLSAEEMPTVEYRVSGATERKYMSDRIATLVNDPNCWQIKFPIVDNSFDFTWVPHPHDPPYIYVWGNQHLTAPEMPTVEYHVPGATERKYMNDRIASVKNDPNCWKVLHQIDTDVFDFTWTPHPHDPPFIYVWGNQFLSAEEMPTVEYHVEGATERKYMSDQVATLVNDPNCWKVLHQIDTDVFDFTWTPHPWDPPLIYVWGNQFLSAEEMPTIEYHVPGATERKYMSDSIATLVNDPTCWQIKFPIVDNSFDFTWVPHPHDPPYIYVWGNQHLTAPEMPTVEYHVPGATERKYMSDCVAQLSSNAAAWNILIPVDNSSFDFTWTPHPHDPPLIYVWGNQWNDAATEPTVEYTVEGATERKYMDDRVARVAADMTNWTVPIMFAISERHKRFDYSWRPNPHSPPQIYQWEGDGPIYTVPHATDIVLMRYEQNTVSEGDDTVDAPPVVTIPRYTVTTTLEDLIALHDGEVFWALNPDLDYEGFDFNWRPDDSNFRHLNVFGNALIKDTRTYYVNGPLYKLGHRQINYVEVEHSFNTVLSMFWVDMGTPDGNERYEAFRSQYPDVVRVRYMSSWVDTINRAIKKSKTKLCWVLCSHYDYSGFEFNFYPSSWQIKQLHVFGTQHSHWGHTYLVNTEVFPEATRYVKVIEHLQNINHVRSKRVVAASIQHDILWIDVGVDAPAIESHRTVYKTVFQDSYLNTLREWFNSNPHLMALENYRIWVVPNIVDHTTFDFTFTPDPFQHDQLHVFASRYGRAKQKFGDIMLINVGEFAKVMNSIARLEDYPKKVHYVGHHCADRLPHPVIEHGGDSQVEGLQQLVDSTTVWPYYQLRTADSVMPVEYVPSIWSEDHHVVNVLSSGASDIMVPRDAISVVSGEVYDYPRIDTLTKLQPSAPLDIVYISNGEPVAEDNWAHLQQTLKRRGIKNRVHRVQNVGGRIRSQHAAANVVDSGWYFLVNGKVRVSESFDWSWQPDRLQIAKHYIFTVTNPVNGLEYGHQAIVANNRKLTLATVEPTGLDFTMSSPHEVVEMNCGVALYNTDAWTAWRTAFRECVKLAVNTDEVSQQRLHTWTTVGEGEWGEWSIRGAVDAVEWVRSVDGNMAELLKSYDWAWLEERYNSTYEALTC